MVGLAIRRKTSAKKAGGYAAKRKIAAKKNKMIAHKAVKAPLYMTRINTYLTQLESYINDRRKKFGAGDQIAKKLGTIHTQVKNELKKANPINANLAKTLNHIPAALRGVPNVPKTVRSNLDSLKRFLRDHTRSETIKFVNMMEKMVNPLSTEFKKIEQQLNHDIKRAKTGKIQWKVDSALSRRFNTLNNNLSKFKTKWLKRWNSLMTYGNPQVKSAINKMKRQLDELQKACRRNMTLINRYAKTVKPQKGFKTQILFGASHLNPLESKFKMLEKECETYRMKAQQFVDQLKAVKVF